MDGASETDTDGSSVSCAKTWLVIGAKNVKTAINVRIRAYPVLGRPPETVWAFIEDEDSGKRHAKNGDYARICKRMKPL